MNLSAALSCTRRYHFPGWLLAPLLFFAGALSASDEALPPTQIRSLDCLYRVLIDQTPNEEPSAHVCPDLDIQHSGRLRAIGGTDFRVDQNGAGVVWFELFSAASTGEVGAARTNRTTYELKFGREGAELQLLALKMLGTPKEIPDVSIVDALERSRIASVVYAWLSLLESSTLENRLRFVSRHLSGGSLVPESGDVVIGDSELAQWLTAEAKDHPALRQRVEKIEWIKRSDGSYQIRFIVDWKATSKNGDSVVGRRAYRWSVEISPRGRVAVRRIQLRDLLPLPNMATRFFC